MAYPDERVRCFVAIELPAEARQCIGTLVAGLREAEVRGLRPVNPEAVHLTLKFLGDVPASQVDAVAAALEGAAAAAHPFDLELRGLGAFPDLRRPRVLWVGVGGDLEALQQLYGALEAALAALLYGALEAALAALGFPPEGRAFTPHLTLARLRDGTPPQERARAAAHLTSLEWEEGAAVPVGGVSLVRSTLRPGGAVYSRLHWAGFGGGG